MSAPHPEEETLLAELASARARLAELERAESERAATATELRRSQDRLAEVQRLARLGSWEWDLATDAVVISDEVYSIMGRRPDEATATFQSVLANVVHPDDHPIVSRILHDALTLRRPYDARLRIVQPDGAARTLHVRGGGHYDPGGRPVRLHGTAQDVTEIYEAQAEMAASEARHRSIIGALEEGIVVHDSQGAIQTANASAERILGLSHDQMIGRTSLDPRWRTVREDGKEFPGDEHPAMRSLRTGRSFSDVVMGVHHPNGALRWISVNTQPLFRAGETLPYAVVSSFADITDLRQQQLALKAEKEFSESLINSSLDGIVALDCVLRITLWNPAMERFTGVYAPEVVGKGALDLFPDLSSFGEDLFFREALDGRTFRVGGEPIRHPLTGKVAYFERHYSPQRSGSGEIIGVIGLVREITERKLAEEERLKLEAQIQHAQKLESLGVLAGGIAHDFNNLLVGILGNAGLALMDLPSSSPVRPVVEQIERAAVRASELTRQMLAYSGKGRFIIEAVDLARLVEEMAHLLRISISKSADLRFNFSGGIPPIQADATQIRQVVMNLITNASDAVASQAGGRITLSTGMMRADREYLMSTYFDDELAEGDYVYVEVEDTGCGMDEETRARIFDPFFTTKFTGRGLGLAAVLGIVRGHRGAIKVRSEPGHGTAIRALFPADLADDETDSPDEPAPSGGWTSRGRVLLIDDEESVRQVMIALLARLGLEVSQACDGPEGVALFEADPARYDLVLLDMTMPRMGGEEAFHRIREIRPDARIALMSGYSQLDAAQRLEGEGHAGFLQKPFQPDDLERLVRAALEP